MPTQKKEITVIGMHCAGCAMGIEAMLKNTKGIKTANVNYNTENAYVEYDDKVLNPEKIAKVITNGGYKVVLDNKKKAKN